MKRVSNANHFMLCVWVVTYLVWYWKQWMISFLTFYRWWKVKFGLCPVDIGLRSKDVFSPYSRKAIWSVSFLFDCELYRMSYWINVVLVWRYQLCTSVCYIFGLSDDLPIAIPLKYLMYIFAIIRNNGDPLAKHSYCQ